MKHRLFYGTLSVVLLLSMVLTACGPQATSAAQPTQAQPMPAATTAAPAAEPTATTAAAAEPTATTAAAAEPTATTAVTEPTATTAAAGPTATTGAAGTSGGKTYALVPKNLGNPYFDTANKGAQEAAKELGVTVNYQGPATADATQQIQLLNSLIAQKVSGLAISADDSDALVPTGKQAMDAGIPVVTWDSAISPGGRTVHINQAVAAGYRRDSDQDGFRTGGRCGQDRDSKRHLYRAQPERVDRADARRVEETRICQAGTGYNRIRG